jgi:segregation and condensation protein A
MQNYKLEQFEGPLDLLLQMIQKEELDITKVSLANVAEQFVQYIEAHPDNIGGHELSDFLLVATQLLLLKSQLLLPDIKPDDELNADALETQLKLYRRFVGAAQALKTRIDQHQFSYARIKSSFVLAARFSPPPALRAEQLAQAMQAILVRLEPIVILPESIMEKTVTLHEKMRHIQKLLKSAKGVSFRALLDQSRSKIEKIVSFLALLELVKQEEVAVSQTEPFDDILIHKR